MLRLYIPNMTCCSGAKFVTKALLSVRVNCASNESAFVAVRGEAVFPVEQRSPSLAG